MNKYQVAAMIILIVFYGAYFVKAFSLKKIGIKSNRMARGKKPKKTLWIEFVLQVATFLIALIQIACIQSILPSVVFINFLSIIGLILSLTGAIVFIIAMRTMRRNWRAGIDLEQNTDLVVHGIYQYSRNPTFLGFNIFYFGVLISFPNLVLAVLTILCSALFHLQILEEEKFLKEIFNEKYLIYMKKTKRYYGRRIIN